MSSKTYDVVVIGGGIVGLATARAIVQRYRVSLAVLEAESRPATHQTGNNSGVIHSGLYYKPGSLKAINCATGRDAMYAFCKEHEIAHENCGKVVVALRPDEMPRLDELERRGRANGLTGIKRLAGSELQDYEPNLPGHAGLWVPETGIVDYKQVAAVMADELRRREASVITGARVQAVRRGNGFVLETPAGEYEAKHLVNCAGLQSDRIARLCGVDPGLQIIPFRGEYYVLKPECHHLVRNLIYPVPDPRFPFLGVHFTRMIHGGVEAGPNAVLALKREGYGTFSFSARDLLETLTFPGFWRMAARHWKTGAGEVHRSLSKSAFVRALRKLLPALGPGDVERGGAGVRAQAVAPDGSLLDDFRLHESEGMLHVLNAPSPGATASLSIGQNLAQRAGKQFSLSARA